MAVALSTQQRWGTSCKSCRNCASALSRPSLPTSRSATRRRPPPQQGLNCQPQLVKIRFHLVYRTDQEGTLLITFIAHPTSLVTDSAMEGGITQKRWTSSAALASSS